MKFPLNTITVLNYDKKYNMLYIGDSEGYLLIYRLNIGSKQIEFE